jgi:hypothetical protein
MPERDDHVLPPRYSTCIQVAYAGRLCSMIKFSCVPFKCQSAFFVPAVPLADAKLTAVSLGFLAAQPHALGACTCFRQIDTWTPYHSDPTAKPPTVRTTASHVCPHRPKVLPLTGPRAGLTPTGLDWLFREGPARAQGPYCIHPFHDPSSCRKCSIAVPGGLGTPLRPACRSIDALKTRNA